MCQVAVCEAESSVSKYICFDCLVRIFLRAAAHRGNIGVVTWHDFTWHGWGYIFLLPPYPRLSCARTRASFGLRGRAVLVARNSWTSLGVWGPGLPPIHRLGRALALPFANTIFISQIIISNLNVKSNFQTADRYIGNVQNHIQ
jgi:hypothetical protein